MARTKKRRIHQTMAAAVVLTLLSAGCGGNEKDKKGTDEPTTTTVQEASESSADEPSDTTDDAEPDTQAGTGGAMLSAGGSENALEDGSEASVTSAIGVPPELVAVEGRLQYVSAEYAVSQFGIPPEATYVVETVQEKPIDETATALRSRFTEQGYTFDPSEETETELYADKEGEAGSQHSLQITLEDVGDGGTEARLFLVRTLAEGAPPEIKGDIFAFVDNLSFYDDMTFESAQVSIERGEDEFDDDSYLSFSSVFALEDDGYDDAVDALDQACAGDVEGYSCDGTPEAMDGDLEGVYVERFESPDRVEFEARVYKGDDDTPPSVEFDFIGDGLGG